jgi:FkbM family methyltransferase
MAGGRAALTKIRGVLAATIAAVVDLMPALEPAFVRAGHVVQRSYPLASLYYHAHTMLTARLRDSGRRFRRLTIGGLTLDLDITDHSARLLYFQSVPYEPEVTRHLIAALGPGDVLVDVGANAGFFTALAAVRVGPAGRIVAFEPHPAARASMQALLSRNGLADRVDVVASAVGARVTPSVKLHLAADSVLSTLVPAAAPLGADYAFDRAIEVPLTTVDAWFADRPDLAFRIALIKIDVEGFEGDVVAGMTATMAAAPRAIVICETRPDSEADRRLRAAGFGRETLESSVSAFGNYLYRRRP